MKWNLTETVPHLIIRSLLRQAELYLLENFTYTWPEYLGMPSFMYKNLEYKTVLCSSLNVDRLNNVISTGALLNVQSMVDKYNSCICS